MRTQYFIRNGATLAMLASLNLAAGCGEADDGTTDAKPEVTIDDLAASYAAAYCTAVKTCFGDAWDFYGPEGKGEDCVTLYTRTFEDSELSLLKDLVASGKVTYDAAKAHTCVETVKDGGCQYLGSNRPDVCTEAARGHAMRGAECSADLECDGDDYCQRDQGCPGICTAPGQTGAACLRDAACASGLSCETNVCEQPLAIGAACSAGGACTVGAACIATDPANPTGSSKCTLLKDLFVAKSGESCSQLELCEAPLACLITGNDPVTQAITGICANEVGSGETCGLSLPDQCQPGHFCAGIDVMATPPVLTGSCEAAPVAGEACGAAGPVGEPVCSPYTRCVANVCAEMQRLTGPCTDAAGCYSGSCVGNQCEISNACQ